MSLNPYAHYLDGQDPLVVLAATPRLLHQACCELSPEQIEAAWAPGKWSTRQICAHLADCELAFSFRLRQTLAAKPGEVAVLQPFDQEAWSQRYDGYDLPAALELFCAARAWNLRLVSSLSPEDFARDAMHPERGSTPFQMQLETMAGHDLNHLAQVEAVVPG